MWVLNNLRSSNRRVDAVNKRYSRITSLGWNKVLKFVRVNYVTFNTQWEYFSALHSNAKFCWRHQLQAIPSHSTNKSICNSEHSEFTTEKKMICFCQYRHQTVERRCQIVYLIDSECRNFAAISAFFTDDLFQ